MKFDLTKVVKDTFGIPSLTRNEDRKPVVEIDVKGLGEKQILHSWEGMSRPHRGDPTSAKSTRTFTVIGIVIAFVLIILQEFFLLLVIGSMIFVSYVLTRTPPERTTYSISTHGVSIGDQIYYWSEMDRFFFTEFEGSHILAVDLVKTAAPRLFLTYIPGDREKLTSVLSQHLVQLEKEPKTLFDRVYDSIKDKLNLG